MVLGVRAGGVVGDHAPSRPRKRVGEMLARVIGGERGSQALEFAMVLPLVGMLIAVLVNVGLLLGDVVIAQGIAREVARTAAVEGPSAAHQVGEQLAGQRDVRIEIDGRDGLVDVRIALRSTVFAGASGVAVEVPARAVMRPEGPLTEAIDG